MSEITMEFARRDDCLDRMVPSELRQLIGERDSLKQQLDQAEARICRQHEYLQSLINICTKQAKLLDSTADPLVELTQRFLMSGEIDSGPHKGWLLRKQAEVLEECQLDLEGLPEYLIFSDAEMVGLKCAIQYCKGEAQRLRGEATK